MAACRAEPPSGSLSGGAFLVRAEEFVDPAEQIPLVADVVDIPEQLRARPQGQDVDVEVMLGLDPVAFRGAVLAEQDQGAA